jgi:hypothetical protein
MDRRLARGRHAVEHGGQGWSHVEWFLVEEQLGRCTNAPSWHMPSASDFRALGYLIVATSEDDVRAAHLRLAMQRERGLDARWVTARARAGRAAARAGRARDRRRDARRRDRARARDPRRRRGAGALAGLAGIVAPVGGVRHHVFVTSPAPELAAGPLPMGFDVEAGLYWRQEEDGLLFGIGDPAEAPGEARGIDEGTQRASRASSSRGCCP